MEPAGNQIHLVRLLFVIKTPKNWHKNMANLIPKFSSNFLTPNRKKQQPFLATFFVPNIFNGVSVRRLVKRAATKEEWGLPLFGVAKRAKREEAKGREGTFKFCPFVDSIWPTHKKGVFPWLYLLLSGPFWPARREVKKWLWDKRGVQMCKGMGPKDVPLPCEKVRHRTAKRCQNGHICMWGCTFNNNQTMRIAAGIGRQ